MENTITDEQIQQITEAFDVLIKIVDSVTEAFMKLFREMWFNLKQFIEKNEKIKKYLKIYNRTNNQRIKQKQITKILKLYKKIK